MLRDEMAKSSTIEGSYHSRESNSGEDSPMLGHGYKTTRYELESHLESARASSSAGSALLRICCCCCCGTVLGLATGGAIVDHCIERAMGRETIVLPLAEELPSLGAGVFTFNNLSEVPRSRWTVLSERLTNRWTSVSGSSFGYASVQEAPQLLFEGSKVNGVFEQVPEPLRGVFWLQGNPLLQELAVLHYGQWYEDSRTLLLPNAPWTGAWFGGESSEHPGIVGTLGRSIFALPDGRTSAESCVHPSGLHRVQSLAFAACPADAECQKGDEMLAYARLMSHPNGNLSEPGVIYLDGETIERVGPSTYFRRAEVFCGLLGGETGYNMTRIIDAEGDPVEPFFTEYQAVMAGDPLIVWAGLPQRRGISNTTAAIMPEGAGDDKSLRDRMLTSATANFPKLKRD